MLTRLFQLSGLTIFVAVFTAATAAAPPSSSPTADIRAWAAEQMPGDTVTTEAGALVITDVGGSTVWLREKLTAPVVISYEATVVVHDGPYDRLSDLNCFWMAGDPHSPGTAPFAPTLARTGKFSDYDSLHLYYVGYGGNKNSTTRFRRYDGTAARPLLPEHDLSDKKFLLQPNHAYHIELTALPDGTVRYRRDGELIFDYRDPSPLRTGWFALRTVKSHLLIRDLKITHPQP